MATAISEGLGFRGSESGHGGRSEHASGTDRDREPAGQGIQWEAKQPTKFNRMPSLGNAKGLCSQGAGHMLRWVGLIRRLVVPTSGFRAPRQASALRNLLADSPACHGIAGSTGEALFENQSRAFRFWCPCGITALPAIILGRFFLFVSPGLDLMTLGTPSRLIAYFQDSGSESAPVVSQATKAKNTHLDTALEVIR